MMPPRIEPYTSVARQMRGNMRRKKARNSAKPTRPYEKMTVQNWPCVPREGSHGEAEGRGAPKPRSGDC